MKKILFIAIAFCSFATIGAQSVTVTKSYEILNQASALVFNKDGNMLLYNALNEGTLGIYFFDTQKAEKIDVVHSGGFHPVFSNDNKRIFYKNSVYESRLRSEGIMSYDIKTKEKIQLLQPKRMVKHVYPYHNGVMASADNKIIKATFGETTAKFPTYTWSDDNKLRVFVDGKTRTLKPTDDSFGYIWSSVSPDGTKLMYNNGFNTVVADLDGNVLYNLGYLNAPVWYNDKFVVGMQDQDDGHTITSSIIVIKSIDGKFEKTISDSKHIATSPCCSAKAGKVAYTSDEGKVIVVELTIK